MPPTWNPDDYQKNPTTQEFVRELNQLVDEYHECVGRFTGKTCIAIKYIRDHKNVRKLIEYWPEHNEIKKTEDDHAKVFVPKELSDMYHEAVEDSGVPVRDPKIFIELLRKIIIRLNESEFKNERNISDVNKYISISGEQEDNYLPVYEDFEFACKKCSRSIAMEIPLDAILDTMEKELVKVGYKLHKDWRSITEENVATWSHKTEI